MELTQEQLTELKDALTALKEARELMVEQQKTYGEELGDVKETLAKVNPALDTIEETKQRLDNIEAKANRPGNGDKKDEVPFEHKAFLKFIAKGEEAMEPEERKTLSRADDTAGGYVASSQMQSEIIETITEFSNMRGVARVVPTTKQSIEWVTKEASYTAGWTVEQGTRTETTGLAFGKVTIPAEECYALLYLTNQLIEDADINIESYATDDAGMQLAVLEGTAFVSGNGVGKPEGFLSNTTLTGTYYTPVGLTSTFPDDEGSKALITCQHAMKDPYNANATWVMNRTTLGLIRKMRDGMGNWLWIPGLTEGLRPQILGRPYITMTDMPDVATNAYIIGYGDWRRGYVIADRLQVSVLRDPYTSKKSGVVELYFRKRVGGKVVLPEALRVIKIAAS